MNKSTKSKSAVAIDPMRTQGYQGSVNKHDSHEKAFINNFALVRTYQQKLNRESYTEAR